MLLTSLKDITLFISIKVLLQFRLLISFLLYYSSFCWFPCLLTFTLKSIPTLLSELS